MAETTDRPLLLAIQELVLAQPQLANWPEFADLTGGSSAGQSTPCWEYPLIGAQAVEGQQQVAIPAAAAIFCLLQSIHLVDDILDNDPSGLYHRLGVGETANLALAFQAAATGLFSEHGLPPKIAVAAQHCVAKIALATADGQRLDAVDITTEQQYWTATLAKTPPLFGGALELGALLAGAETAVCQQLAAFGEPIGKLIQLNDDLRDAMEVPASPDWQNRGSNLAILYGSLAEHPDQQRFIDLIQQVADHEKALEEAQEILVRSGALSYCTFHMIETYRQARQDLGKAGFSSNKALLELLEELVKPLHGLLGFVGVENTEELFAQ